MKPDSFGERLRWLREQKGWTLQNLADAILFDKSYLSRLESGKSSNPSPRFISALIRVFDTGKTWLLTGEGEPYGAYATLPSKETRTQNAEQGQSEEESMAEKYFLGDVLRILIEDRAPTDILDRIKKISSASQIPNDVKSFWMRNISRAVLHDGEYGPSIFVDGLIKWLQQNSE